MFGLFKLLGVNGGEDPGRAVSAPTTPNPQDTVQPAEENTRPVTTTEVGSPSPTESAASDEEKMELLLGPFQVDISRQMNESEAGDEVTMDQPGPSQVDSPEPTASVAGHDEAQMDLPGPTDVESLVQELETSSEAVETVRPGTYSVNTPHLTQPAVSDEPESHRSEATAADSSQQSPLPTPGDVNKARSRPSKIDNGNHVATSKAQIRVNGARNAIAVPQSPRLPKGLKKKSCSPVQPKAGPSRVGALTPIPQAVTGFKFYKPSVAISNRNMIRNAIERTLFPGQWPTAKKALMAALDEAPPNLNHFLILVRNPERCPYRGLYAHVPEKNRLEKLHGVGPIAITGDGRIEKFLKYNSATKAFEVVETKHLSITIDGFTVANSFWTVKKSSGGGARN